MGPAFSVTFPVKLLAEIKFPIIQTDNRPAKNESGRAVAEEGDYEAGSEAMDAKPLASLYTPRFARTSSFPVFATAVGATEAAQPTPQKGWFYEALADSS